MTTTSSHFHVLIGGESFLMFNYRTDRLIEAARQIAAVAHARHSYYEFEDIVETIVEMFLDVVDFEEGEEVVDKVFMDGRGPWLGMVVSCSEECNSLISPSMN